MKLSKQREKHVEEVHSLEKKLQQAIHEKESAEKEFSTFLTTVRYFERSDVCAAFSLMF